MKNLRDVSETTPPTLSALVTAVRFDVIPSRHTRDKSGPSCAHTDPLHDSDALGLSCIDSRWSSTKACRPVDRQRHLWCRSSLVRPNLAGTRHRQHGNRGLSQRPRPLCHPVGHRTFQRDVCGFSGDFSSFDDDLNDDGGLRGRCLFSLGPGNSEVESRDSRPHCTASVDRWRGRVLVKHNRRQ